MNSFREIIEKAQAAGPRKVAIAGAPEEELREAMARASAGGIAEAIVFADAPAAVRAVKSGAADILMKGSCDTKAFMQAVLDRDCGLRTGRLVSHIAVFEAMGRLMLITDGGICLQPTLEEKAEIVRNALPVARALGIAVPKVAVLAAVEKVNPKMPETVDAEALAKMGIPGCEIQGPLAVDNAVSPEAARLKGIAGPVAGRADIFLVPSVLAGNMFAKAVLYFGGCPFGGIVAGTSRPVAFLSRSDDADTRLNTIALACALSGDIAR
jgi:phosphate butyryltransferase